MDANPPVEPGAQPIPSQPLPPPAAPPLLPPSPAFTPAVPGALSASDERTLAMIAHLSNLLNPVTGFIGMLVPLGMFVLYKDRSRYVAYQALQSFVFQLIWWFGAGALAIVLWTVSSILAVFIIGCFIMPLAGLLTILPVASLIYSIYAGIECSQGRDFRYWLIGDWVRGTLTN